MFGFCLCVFVFFKGDYDVVINDYEKAKSLFGKTEVQVFKKCKIRILLFAAFFFFKLKGWKAHSSLKSFMWVLYGF